MTNFKSHIKQIGIKQTRIAEALDIRPDLFNRYINGKVPMPQKHQERLEKILSDLERQINEILNPKNK